MMIELLKGCLMVSSPFFFSFMKIENAHFFSLKKM